MGVLKIKTKTGGFLNMEEADAQTYIAKWGGEIVAKLVIVSTDPYKCIYVPVGEAARVEREIAAVLPDNLIVETPAEDLIVKQSEIPVVVEISVRLAAIVAAVKTVFDTNNAEDFTGQGLPKASVLQTLSGRTGITGVERQAALDIYNNTR